MPKRDPLAVLARLRRLDTTNARRLLAERLGRAADAAERASQAAAAIHREAGQGSPGDYGAWLQRGLAERERAARQQELAEAATETARAALAAARIAERIPEKLMEDRDRAARQATEARRQAILDEFAGRPRGEG